MIGHSELLLIVLLILVLFSANRFPHIMENFAKGIKSYKKTMRENEDGEALADTKTKKSKAKKTTASVRGRKSSSKKK